MPVQNGRSPEPLICLERHGIYRETAGRIAPAIDQSQVGEGPVPA